MTDRTLTMEEWCEDWRAAVEWAQEVLDRALPVIEDMEAELAAADWCHPGGAEYVRHCLTDAREVATGGDHAETGRLLGMARRKLDIEWWWWSRGGCDFPPKRPYGEFRWAEHWLPPDGGDSQ
jgi:hypothetical protein